MNDEQKQQPMRVYNADIYNNIIPYPEVLCVCEKGPELKNAPLHTQSPCISRFRRFSAVDTSLHHDIS